MKLVMVLLSLMLLGAAAPPHVDLPEQANDRASEQVAERNHRHAGDTGSARTTQQAEQATERANDNAGFEQPPVMPRRVVTQDVRTDNRSQPVETVTEYVTERETICCIEAPGDPVKETEIVTKTRFIDRIPTWVWVLIGAGFGGSVTAMYYMIKDWRRFERFKRAVGVDKRS